jgi:hypothetical protein
MQFFAIPCRYSPTREGKKEELFLLDALEVGNFIIRKKFYCQASSDSELVNLFAWDSMEPPSGGAKIVRDVTPLMEMQQKKMDEGER